MNNFKKIGLTALAGSLAVSSAVAGELSVSGAASLGLSNTSGTQTGKAWTMGNSVTFTGSGELDNGLNIGISFELDQGASNNSAKGFDSHSLSISSDDLGTLVFHGHGGGSAQGSIDTTAAGDLWNAGPGITGISSAGAGNNMMVYTLPAMVDDLAISASYAPDATNDSHTSFAITYTGVEGLSVSYGQGDGGAPGAEYTATTMSASYAVGSFTLKASNTDNDNAGSTSDREVSSYGITYTVSDDLSIGYGMETFDKEGSPVDEEVRGFNVSYTTGGMTLGAALNEGEGIGNSAASEKDRWKLTASFAF